MNVNAVIRRILLPVLCLASAMSSYAQHIDYMAVQRALDRASQPTLWQRIASRMSMPMISSEKVQLSAHAGIAYTAETNLALTLTGSATYRTREHYPQSSAHATAMASIEGFYRVALGGEHLFGSGNGRLIYDAGVASLPIRFWGLGYEAATSNQRSRYTHLIANGTATYLHHIAGGLHLGAGVDLRYGKGHNFEPLAEEYLHKAGQNVLSTYTTGLSLTARYDRRDNAYNPSRGIYLSLTGEVRPKALGSFNQTLWHVTAQANLYQSLWQGAVATLDLYGDAWSSATPWFYWPMMGGQSRMRGYYYGRYTNSKMATAQIELRQQVWGAIGVVAWGGAGTVFSSLKTFDWGEILPTYGVGLRLKAGERTALRIDYGLGRRCSGIIINVNEAF